MTAHIQKQIHVNSYTTSSDSMRKYRAYEESTMLIQYHTCVNEDLSK